MKFVLVALLTLLPFTHQAAAGTPSGLPDLEIRCSLHAENSDRMSLNLGCENPKPLNPLKIPHRNVSHFNVILQTGEYAGLISPGIDFRFFKRNTLTFLGGYVPGKIDGKQLWQLNLKYQIEPFRNYSLTLPNGVKLSFNPVHLGIGVVYGIHENLFTRQGPQYPSDYYTPTAFRYTVNLGTAVGYRRLTFYVDYTALDVGAISYFWDHNGKFFRDHYSFFGLSGIGTLGGGVKFKLMRSPRFSSRGLSP